MFGKRHLRVTVKVPNVGDISFGDKMYVSLFSHVGYCIMYEIRSY